MAESNVISECALVFDRAGRTLYWHVPVVRSAYALEDSRALWEVLWRERARLGGVAHTHPWAGPGAPSMTDLTTFAACEAALGRRVVWVIATADAEGQWVWVGPERLAYGPAPERLEIEDMARLRALSGIGGSPHVMVEQEIGQEGKT